MKSKIAQGLHLHFDPCSGIAGDMTVAALVDAGVPEKVVLEAVKAVGIERLKVGFEKRKRGAFVGLGFRVEWPGKGHGHGHDHGHGHGHAHEHRDYAAIRRLLRGSPLGAEAKRLAERIFARIAEEEAALHGVALDKVAFHEVGAWDSIADIVGAAAALAWLEPSAITSTPPVLGSGVIHTAHGPMPVPAPATAALLRGLPALAEGEGELTTPTGAAILAMVVREFGGPPPLRLVAQGFGAGTREHADRPNVLRVLLGQPVGRALPGAADEVVLVAANIDDMNPQLAEPLMAELFAAGALDVWFSPITMKKSRPATEISALCPPNVLAEVERAFFANSSTIGVRRQVMQRTVLARSLAKVKTAYGYVRVKVAAREGEIFGATPEFEDCRKAAGRAGVPVRQVVAEASAAAWALTGASRKRRS
ncbi:MAG: nickel pincer cofactor biosynthesis protein LarC [Deltaproteobacteria bacterium]|nr:nickel pincer cofactor biosynthesis protein LarC [Deltaproteobacteria bacterium]